MWFFLKLKKNDEITAMKISGMSNFSIILFQVFYLYCCWYFFYYITKSITSVLVKKYETIKGSYYEKDQDYLAAITRKWNLD